MLSCATSRTSLLCPARKVTISKWQKAIATGNTADTEHAAANDLRSWQDGLSFWQTDGSGEDVNLIITAIATASNYPDRIDIIILPAQEVAQTGASVEQTTGRTPFTKAIGRHVDVRASESQITQIAGLIADALRKNKPIRTTRSGVIALAAKSLRNGEIDWEELSSSWQNAIKHQG